MTHFYQIGFVILPLRGAFVSHRCTRLSFPERILFTELLNGIQIVLSNDQSAQLVN